VFNILQYQDLMSRKILFSVPSPDIKEKIKAYLFPTTQQRNVLAYMSSDGSDESSRKYIDEWKQYAEANNSDFVEINNSLRGEFAEEEKLKLTKANILIITGGNTFRLLKHLRESGLDGAVEEFAQKEENILAGFSAGAIVLSPSVKTATQEDNNEIHLIDFTGLNIVPFLVVPHADTKQEYVKELEDNGEQVCALNNDEFKVI